MRSTEFHNREKEIKEITNILNAKPTLITFIYGPINSGKTELINKIVLELPDDYIVFYINLRGRYIRSYEEFLDVLFEIDEERKIETAKEYAKTILKDLKIIGGIPIPINLFEQIFERKERSKDVFKYIESFMQEISKKYVPVLILDELQVIGDIKIDDLLIYKLFDFFIRLTKELHLCHVFAVSSDSLFIELVYSEAMLQERCRYLLVDDFDYETTKVFLDGYEFSEKEKEVVWEYVGGKPVYLVELTNAKRDGKEIEREAKRLLQIRTSQILSIFDEIALEKVEFVENDITNEFKNFETEETIRYDRVNKVKIFLVGRNILFIDPTQRTIKPQSKLNLLAIRAVLENLSFI